MRSNAANTFEIKQSKLLSVYSLVKAKRNEIYRIGDVIIIHQNGEDLLCAKLSGASYLIRKHLDIAENTVYRQNVLPIKK